MQNNATGFRDPILRAVIGAIKTVFSFLLLYITNLIALLLILSDAFASLSTEEAVCAVVVAACLAGQSPNLEQPQILRAAHQHFAPHKLLGQS